MLEMKKGRCIQYIIDDERQFGLYVVTFGNCTVHVAR